MKKPNLGRPSSLPAGTQDVLIELARLTGLSGAKIASALEEVGFPPTKLPKREQAYNIVNAALEAVKEPRKRAVPVVRKKHRGRVPSGTRRKRCPGSLWAHIVELKFNGEFIGHCLLTWEPRHQVLALRYRPKGTEGDETTLLPKFVRKEMLELVSLLKMYCVAIDKVGVILTGGSAAFDHIREAIHRPKELGFQSERQIGAAAGGIELMEMWLAMKVKDSHQSLLSSRKRELVLKIGKRNVPIWLASLEWEWMLRPVPLVSWTRQVNLLPARPSPLRALLQTRRKERRRAREPLQPISVAETARYFLPRPRSRLVEKNHWGRRFMARVEARLKVRIDAGGEGDGS